MKKAELEQLIAEQAEAIKVLKVELKEAKKGSKVEQKLKEAVLPQITEEQPVPFEFKALVHSILNTNFGIRVRALSDRPGFEFTVSVPKKYSNAGEPHWQTYKEDLRIKVISYAEGVNGVRDFCQRIFQNFGEDIRALITLNRTELEK